jgi:hypothetical protein
MQDLLLTCAVGPVARRVMAVLLMAARGAFGGAGMSAFVPGCMHGEQMMDGG